MRLPTTAAVDDLRDYSVPTAVLRHTNGVRVLVDIRGLLP